MNAEVLEMEREVDSTVVDVAVLGAISRAELDGQITTARAYPRSIKRFVDECREMACLNEKVAAECGYILPRDGKNIEGPSVRLSEIVQSAWGNCQSGARVVEEGEHFVTAQGIFYDLQRNVKITMEVRRRITGKGGRRYSQDMVNVTGNAACSIALRNAIFRGIPKAFWSDIYEEAKRVAKGDIKSLVTNRTAALDWLARRGVTQQVVIDALGVPGVQDIGLEELGILRGLMTALKDGDATVETLFAPKSAPDAEKPKTEAPKSKSQKEPEAPKSETTPPLGGPTTQQPASTEGGMNVDQVIVIRDKLKESKVEETLLLGKFEVGSIEEIKADRFKMVCNWIGAAALAK